MGHQSINAYILHHENSICYRISSVLSSYACAVVEEVFMSELPHQQIFDRGDHFHLLQRRAARSATIVGLWWTVSDYCILQHRHRGCCPFVGGSRPERSKFVSELSRFTLFRNKFTCETITRYLQTMVTLISQGGKWGLKPWLWRCVSCLVCYKSSVLGVWDCFFQWFMILGVTDQSSIYSCIESTTVYVEIFARRKFLPI